MKGTGIILLVGSIVVVLCILFFPVTYKRIIREGTDRFGAHHALWGKRVKSVFEIADSPVRSVGVILVNLRRAQILAPAHIRILVDGKGEVTAGDVVARTDDEFTWFSLPSRAVNTNDTYTVEVSAPAGLKDSPVGVRFDSESKELAFAVREKVSVYEYVIRWAHDHPDAARRVTHTLFGGIGLAGVLFGVEMLLLRTTPSRSPLSKGEKFAISSPRMRGGGVGSLWVVSLCILFICAIAIRIPLAASLDSAYGGDAFNYLLKSRALIDGQDPFTADPRKAPLYSLLVAPGLTKYVDAVVWERWVSMLAAAGTVVLVPLFLRRFGVPYSLALVGGMLLTVNRDFQFESVQGLSNTLYAFLVFLTAYLFIVGRPYLLAVVSALATLTRYEGGAAMAIFVPASWFLHTIKLKSILRTIIPLIILLSIPFLISPFSHSLGVRTLADIKGDDGLYIAYSWDDFSSNFISFKHFFGRLWVLTEHIGKPFAALGIGMLIGLIGSSPLLTKERLGEVRSCVSYALTTFIFVILIRNSSEQLAYLVQLFALLAGIGVGAAISRIPTRSTAILLMILIQIIVITAILPKTRYYLPVIPFIAMAIIGGVYSIVGRKKSSPALFGALLCVCVISSFAYADAKNALPGQVSDYNEKSAGQTVLLDAARYMKYRPGIVAAAEDRDLQFRTYLPRQRLVTFPDSLRDTNAQYAKLKESGVVFLSETTENPFFANLISEKPEHFEEIATYKTRWADVSATLYRVY